VPPLVAGACDPSSLCNLCVLSVSAVCGRCIFLTTESQNTQRLHGERRSQPLPRGWTDCDSRNQSLWKEVFQIGNPS